MSIRAANVLSTPVLPIGAEEAASVIASWAADGRGRAVCAANVHMVMEAWDDTAFAALLEGADLIVCDGRPLVWACRLQGVGGALHTRGSDLMEAVCSVAAQRGLRVGLYGGAPEVTETVRRVLLTRHHGLEESYCWSPPFRQLTDAEDAAAMAAIATAGVQILLVSLGCPKQERWMIAHRDQMTCVMLGVGAAFDMLAGRIPTAPKAMQRVGLEWAFRLVYEPRRLWRRYAKHNARFVALLLRSELRSRFARVGQRD